MSLPRVESTYVTDECLREWKSGNPSFRVPNPVPTLRFLYELCSAMVRGELPYQKCKAAVDSVEFLDRVSDEDLGSHFADIIAQMAQDITMPGENRSRLIKLAKWLTESALVPVRLFQERCEEEFLWDSEMIKIKAQDLKSKEVRVNTRLLYQQTKFNLLREESEGYAKLVTLLCRDIGSSNHSASPSIIGIIKSLIGHFDLDPNRVFDIVLECFELQPDNNVFLDLIPIFPKSHASQILGFKFQYYQRIEVNRPMPFGLYQLTALLVKEEFIDLDSIYAHLLPKDDEAFEHYNAFSMKQLDEANKIGKINLAATGKDLMDDEKQADVTIDLFSALDMGTEAAFERSSELENNQSLGLLLGFLSVDDWYHAHKLLDRLLPLNPVEHIQICNGLFRLIEMSLSSVFDVAQQMHLEHVRLPSGAGLDSMEASTSGYRSLVDLPVELFEMLTAVGPYLFRNALLLQKVCRVLRAYYSSALELVNRGSAVSNFDFGVIRNRNPRLHLKEAGARIEETLGACLLPSLQLIPANPAVGQEIWEIMNLLPYEVRYRLYGEWEKDDERNPMVLAARQTAKLDTRRTLKRLAKENLKQLGRMVAKLAHSNPMTVLRTIVHQIEAYREMIAPVVDAFKYLTQLEYDVLEYVVIERLAQGGREKLKDDGVNLSDWLQSLASFWGHLCKKYPSMELRGLFQYLVNQLKKGNGIELVLLQELIQQMANVQYTENMTEEQLDAMAGSETLRYQATSFGITRNNKALIKSTNRLRDSLLPKEEPKLAIPLLLLIAQHRSLVVINADAPYIKMVSEMFDRCHGALLQYVEFLGNAVVPATAYAQLIPSLDDLVHQYHLEPEVAFLIFRPVMRLFKCEGVDIFWPLNEDKSTTTPSVEKDSESVEFSRNMFLDLGSSGEPIMWSQLLDTVRSMLPSKAWNSLSPDLYATFWGLTLYDLHVPKDRYAFEISKLHAALKALEELSDNSNSAITKRKKEKERIQESLDRLSSDFQKHEEHVASVRRRLACEKDKWLSSCPDTLKINMEFLQRCIFPRCTFSMPDAVYCAEFVHALHSLQTPFFNTVNHIDVLICKTLQPMLCCCTEYEAGRLGKFLYKTLKLAYKWKNDESLYNSECGNMPGFAVYYRYPNSQRVTYSQFIKVHWKWSSRITRLLIQCLESTESMEIRNALILLTKISKVFPVTRKSGINLEKRVAKIKSDEREDLKVLATGVAAAMAKRKVKWVTEEEFGKGYLELKPAPTVASKALTNNAVAQNNNTGLSISQSETPGGQVVTGSQHFDSGNSFKDLRSKPSDGRLERTESVSVKSDLVNVKLKGGSLVNGSDVQSSLAPATLQSGPFRSIDSSKQIDESTNKAIDENVSKVSSKASADSEARPPVKRSMPSGSHAKLAKQELLKDDNKSGKTSSRASGFAVDRDMLSHPLEIRQSAATNSSNAVTMNGGTGSILIKGSSRASLDTHGSETKAESGAPRSSTAKDDVTEDIPRPSSSRTGHSPRLDNSAAALKIIDKQQKRSSPSEEPDKLNKRRKGDTEIRDLDADVRFLDRDRSLDPKFDRHNPADGERSGNEELRISKATDKPLDRSKDKVNERYDRDYRERVERSDKSRGDDLAEKARDRSIERHGRERSIEKTQERGVDRSFDRLTDRAKDERNKDDRSKLRYGETEKFHNDDRFLGQNLPPPPPLPPNVVPQSVAGRRDEDSDRRFGTARHSQRLSPRHEEKERRRSEETSVLQDEVKRRRDDDIRDRKREEREALPVKAEERERDRDRDKANPLKDDVDSSTASKRRKLKREHLPSVESGEFTAAPTPALTTQSYDGRERGDRKVALAQRAGYSDEPGSRIHSKEAPSKMARHETDPLYDREWDEDKRSQRVELKRRHRK